MDFAEAFKKLKEGHRVRRRRWEASVYLYVQDGRLRYRVWDSFFGDWFSEETRICNHDLMANDWEIYND